MNEISIAPSVLLKMFVDLQTDCLCGNTEDAIHNFGISLIDLIDEKTKAQTEAQ